jgi:5-formyltetrahydrofolate cyclo-ligase
MNTYFIKKDLRDRMKKRRAGIPREEKERMSAEIISKLLALDEYKQATILLTYVPLPSEVNTYPLIEQALADGKRVAVPRCVEGKCHMEFYFIHGVNELEKGSFNLLEPRPRRERLYTGHSGFCALPGLAFDRTGARLGYGCGYYDRFLQKFKGITAGVCFSPLLSDTQLPTGRYDIPANIVLTDREVIRIS